MSTGARIVRAIIRGHATIASINPPGHADPEGWLRLSGRENRTPREVNIADFWFSNRTRSIVKSPKLYFADSGLLCALLNVRSEDALGESPAIGAIWETFVFAQLRDRERRAGRLSSLFFWRDRTREVDFVVDVGGRLELYEAKWTELPDSSDTVNLDFVRQAVGKSRVAAGAVISRPPNSFPLAHEFKALPVTELA